MKPKTIKTIKTIDHSMSLEENNLIQSFLIGGDLQRNINLFYDEVASRLRRKNRTWGRENLLE